MNILAMLANIILPGVFQAVDKAVPDAGQAAALKAQLQAAVLSADSAQLEQQVAVITSEAKGESWLQRNWRPLTMMVFVTIIANNYIIAPYTQAMFHVGVSLPTPPDLWELIKIGLGGYVVGRSVEKAVANWKGN